MGHSDDIRVCALRRQRWVPDRARLPSDCSHSDAPISRLREFKSSGTGDSVVARQASDLGTRPSVAHTRLLQLVPKKDGGCRPVFDLKSLKFKMTTPRVVTNALHRGDWADAYFHVPIHANSKRLLMFALTDSNGLRVFQFRALPFGLTSAPRVFTKVILPLGHQAHMRAISLLRYLEDWLIRSPNKLLFSRQTGWLLEVMRRAGFVLNDAKSQMTPTQRITHIGVEYHLDLDEMCPRWREFRSLTTGF